MIYADKEIDVPRIRSVMQAMKHAHPEKCSKEEVQALPVAAILFLMGAGSNPTDENILRAKSIYRVALEAHKIAASGQEQGRAHG